MLKKAKYKIAVWGGKNEEEGQKVIEILTLLGAKNKDNLDGLGEDKLYTIGKGLKIVDVESPIPEMPYVRNKLYTAGGFFLNFPFRVDDWVECKDDNLTGQITSLSWNEDEGCVIYRVSFGGGVDYGFYKAVVLAPTIVREVVNIASVLKECPRGMELDSAICTDLYFDFVDDLGKIHCFIQRKNHRTGISFYPNGTLNNDPQDRCVIFPKGKTTWEGFQRPFKDGDIIYCCDEYSDETFTYVAIFKQIEKEEKIQSHCFYNFKDDYFSTHDFLYDGCNTRFATEEEKETLFKAIKDNGYRWNADTKTLERLPKFKVGDRIKHRLTGDVYKVLFVLLNGYGGGVYDVAVTNEIGKSIDIKEQDSYELVPNKEVIEEETKSKDIGEVSDGYHTFNELYEYRMLYNAALFNEFAKQGLYDVHKSRKHSDGEYPFGDSNWFIVMAELPTGQISNHYEMKDWDKFQIPEKPLANKWDEHSPRDVADRLTSFTTPKKGYPKTYEECCKVMGIDISGLEIFDNILDTTEIIYRKNLDRLLDVFRKLLICRDAYRKLYSEEMGLDKPWEPDWKNVDEKKWVISRYGDELDFGFNIEPFRIFAFPTEEVLNTFKENFDKDLETCKELL